MSKSGKESGREAEIGHWLREALISLLAGFIASQSIRHGSPAVRPTGKDAVYALIGFAIIFAAVVAITRLAAQLDAETESRGPLDETES